MLTQMNIMEGDFIRQFIAQYTHSTYLGDAVYVMILLTIGYLISKVIKGIVHLVEKYVTSNTETDLDDKIIQLIDKSIVQFVYIWAWYFSLQEVKDNFTPTAQKVIFGGAVAVLVFLICLFFSRLVTILVQWFKENVTSKTETDIDDELVPLVERILIIIIYIVGAASVLKYFSIDLTGLAIGGAAASFAIGYASQDTLSNMISGFVIMFDRPFRVGDRIRLVASNQIGDVISIGLRSTKILNFDNNVVIIPNSEIAKSQLINLSYPDPAFRIKLDIGVAYGTDLNLVKSLLLDIAKSNKDVLKDPEPKAAFIDFKDSAMIVTLICRIANYKDEFRVSEELRLGISASFAKHNIEIPFPQQVVRVIGNK